MKAAHPFMLIVVQIGSTKRAMFLRTPRRFSAVSIVTGRVAALLLVKSAMSTAGVILPNTCTGFKPLDKRNKGRTTKNWITLPPITTNTYFPMESATTPAEIWAESYAEKATMPSGSVQISPRMSRNNSS